MAIYNRIDPDSDGPSGKFFLRVPRALKAEIEQAASEDRRAVPDYLRLLLEDAMQQRRAARRRSRGKAS